MGMRFVFVFEWIPVDLPPGVWKCPRGGSGKWCSDGALDAGLVVERGSDLLGDERSLSHTIVRL